MVGGYTPEKVALRRAIGLAYRHADARSARLPRAARRSPAQTPCVPHTHGYDPKFRTEMGDYDPARAKALLDMYGYVDRDGDGWREQPDGSPLLLDAPRPTRTAARASSTRSGRRTWTRSACACSSSVAQWPENLKAAQRRQASDVGGRLVVGAARRHRRACSALYSPSIGGSNLSRFQQCRVRRALRPHAAHARRPRARGAVPQAKRIVGRLHAVPPARAPHLQRHDASVARRLPPAVLLAAAGGTTSTSTRASGPG